MTLIAFVPLAIAIVGALVYALASDAKVQELGRIAFLCGLMAFCFLVAGHTVRIG